MNDEIKKIKSVYFIGIGGIGMSAIARFFHSRGIKVSGYDRSETALIKELEAEGMKAHFDESIENIPKDADLVVYTPAVPADHRELVFYQKNGYKVVKRSDVLQMITESSFNICIAGTHGKTTITTMIAHLLRDSGYGCNAFLGGISVNYGTNFWSSEKNVCVVEADEYDRSFLKLNPDVAVISAMDPDHLDIYGTAEAMEQAFIDFSNKIKPGGLLLGKFGLKRGKDLKAAVESFKGVKRRFEYIIPPSLQVERGRGEVVFIDDYAHHPEELRALIHGAKTLFRQKKCTIIFQPHLYTRTRHLANGFAEALDLADQIILLPIYPARELPIEGVSSEMIMAKMRNENKMVLTKDQLLKWIKNDYLKNMNTEFGEVLITAGAGDIDMMVEPVKTVIDKI